MLLGLAEAHQRWRGHKHPRGKKRHLRNGPELGDAADCQVNSEFPGSAGCFRPALCGGSWHFWGSGCGRLLNQSRQKIRRRVSLRACQMESRRSKGQL